ncbi:response regulator transcription factor [Streptomyces mirabilis]|uniref:response regulator transcription factor n=1 Tax=Streptomyces mirabilis TaxID=68239 RepID=UPI003675DD2F
MTRVSAPGGKLSDLEAAVLRHAAEGLTVEATARLLGATAPAVQDTRHRLMGKLGASSLVHAVHLAYQAGILRRERHGDHAGFAAHRYRGEDPWACTQGCPEGERAYRAEQRQRRRQEAAGGPQGAPEAVDGARDVRGSAGAAERRTAARGEAAA